jgi:hypothetical protein
MSWTPQTVGMITIIGYILLLLYGKNEKDRKLLKSSWLISFSVAGFGFAPKISGSLAQKQ